MLGWIVWDFIVKNWALISIGVTVILLVLTPVIVIRKYVRISYNIIKDTPPPLSMGPRDFRPLAGEPVSFRALDGLNLQGMFHRAAEGLPRRGMILFAHEYASEKESCARYCRPLIAAGYDVFTFDFRNHGESSREDSYTARQWVTEREVDDMGGALAFVQDWLRENRLPVEVGLFGISRGAGAGIIATADDPTVTCLCCDGVFSTDKALERLMKRWAYIFATVRFVYQNHPPEFWRFLRWRLLRVARRRLKCEFPSVRKVLMRSAPKPMFFIHGQRDSYIPVELALDLYAIAGQPKHLWIVNGAKHNQCVVVEPDTYARRTVAFFDRYLAGLPTPEAPIDEDDLLGDWYEGSDEPPPAVVELPSPPPRRADAVSPTQDPTHN